jgi:hypothetical protein
MEFIDSELERMQSRLKLISKNSDRKSASKKKKMSQGPSKSLSKEDSIMESCMNLSVFDDMS